MCSSWEVKSTESSQGIFVLVKRRITHPLRRWDLFLLPEKLCILGSMCCVKKKNRFDFVTDERRKVLSWSCSGNLCLQPCAHWSLHFAAVESVQLPKHSCIATIPFFYWPFSFEMCSFTEWYRFLHYGFYRWMFQRSVVFSAAAAAFLALSSCIWHNPKIGENQKWKFSFSTENNSMSTSFGKNLVTL